jgi:cyclohexa-1,5-dienecarbonyl-CoA hydratase
MSAYEFVDVRQDDAVVSIVLNRPPLNVMHIPMMEELNLVLEMYADHPDVAAIVFRARGKAFSAGVDVADHAAEKVGEMIRLFHGLFRKLAASDALTVAAVQGAALGGGCELACFCDIVLASDHAKFGQPEVQVGVFAPVAACILPLQVGIRKAVELNALGATIDAAEALRVGLVSHVYPAEQFETRVEEYLSQVVKLSRPVLRLAKRATVLAAREAIMAHLEQTERLYLNELMKLEDAHEGLAAFLEKRAPVWRHG